MEYTARLEDWYLVGLVLFGTVYEDSKGRFEDGRFIRTSRILPMSMQADGIKEGAIVATNNSSYLLGKPSIY